MIDVVEVTKAFGKVVALDRVSLSIRAGERVALVGSNGSGKTTLMRAMLGLLRVEGRVLVDHFDVSREPERALARIAYIPQIAPPIDAPVGEVARAFAQLRGKPVESIALRASKLGLDVGAIARTRFRDLSGGMRQKLLAAMALAAEAPVLVCDEPTANLDAEARAAFFDEVDARPKDAILVLCSHRADEVHKLVDRVVAMREGKIESDRPTLEVPEARRARLHCVRAS
jgi:ABC-2 type transport system ATP-binding protein